MNQKSKKRFAIIESFKVFSVLGIFYLHIYLFFDFSNPVLAKYYGSFVDHAYSIVTFFFIITGFTLSLGNFENFRSLNLSSYLKFAGRKISALIPLHLMTFLISIPVSRTNVTNSFYPPDTAIPKIFTNVLLLQSYIPDDKFYFSFNSVSWYLSCLISLYLLYPFLAYVINKLKILSFQKIIIFLIIVWVFSLAVNLFLASDMPDWISRISRLDQAGTIYWLLYINPFNRIVNFITGIFAYLIFNKIKEYQISKTGCQLMELAALCILISGFLTMPIVPKELTYNFWLMPFFTVFLTVFAFQKGFLSGMLGQKIISGFGVLVFPFFMIHQLVIRYLSYGLPKIYDSNLLVVMSLFLSVYFSYVYLKIDKNLIRIFSKKISGR
jgi:peptidoglycan/LPS O-acetylase OafA/YrhL